MYVKLGSYPAEYAKEIAELFYDAGIKIEQRYYLEPDFSDVYHVRGQLSELKEKLANTEFKKEIEHWENYLKVADEVLSKVSVDEFKDSFISSFVEEEDIDLKEVIDECIDTILKEKGLTLDELNKIEKKRVLDEALERSREQIIKSFTVSTQRHHYSFIADVILDMLEESGDSKKLPEDPELYLTLREVEIEDPEKYGIDIKTEVTVYELCDIYVNIMECVYEKETIEELAEDFEDVYTLLITADILGAIYSYIKENKKTEISKFAEDMQNFDLGEKIEVIIESGVPEKILKVLEKEKLVKIKKGKLRAV